MSKIEWEQGKFGGHAGHVGGKLRLVSVHYRSQRTGPDYLVSTTLPIRIPVELQGSDDLATAKLMAEKLITLFLGTIGARWK